MWKRLAPDGSPAAEDEWIINFSQQYDCGAGVCQAAFFATSQNLVSWTPVAPDAAKNGGDVFEARPEQNPRPALCVAHS